MVELEIWYDQDTANDFGDGDPAIVVASPEALDTFVDRVLDETKTHTAPPMIEVGIAGNQTAPALHVGLGQERGFIFYMAPDGGWTVGDQNRTDVVTYVYVGNATEITGNTEIPIAEVREGLREFMRTGHRPKIID
ncbi:MAG: Imm1 family immunity protein [Actinomycetota bacterium]|nr:Imm1 family immunity protein [Actinomycetota bacterium]